MRNWDQMQVVADRKESMPKTKRNRYHTIFPCRIKKRLWENFFETIDIHLSQTSIWERGNTRCLILERRKSKRNYGEKTRARPETGRMYVL